MIKAKFSEDMLCILQSTIGQTLLGYECADESSNETVYGNLRLYFNKSVIDLYNAEKDFEGIDDELSCFSCKLVQDNSPFEPFIVSDTKFVNLTATILGIEIISDEVVVNYGGSVIDFDSALVFHTDKGNFTFGRCQWFSEVIFTSFNEDYDTIFPTKSVIESWENEGQNHVEVYRTIRKL